MVVTFKKPKYKTRHLLEPLFTKKKTTLCTLYDSRDVYKYTIRYKLETNTKKTNENNL